MNLRRLSRLLGVHKRPKLYGSIAAVILLGGFLLPEELRIPVDGATTADWNPDTFWYEPWGASGVHKGIDIFANSGRPVLAATGGLVLFSGRLGAGGEAITILGPKWRVHYYAHLKQRHVHAGAAVRRGAAIGSVGNSGNAAGKPSHLHYAIVTMVPYPWRITMQTQGWKRMNYLDPNEKLRADNVE